MERAAQTLRRRLRREDGFTFPELLVAMLVGIIVAGGAVSLLVVAVKAQPTSSERSNQIQQGRALIEAVSRELRQGETVHDATATSLSFETYANSVECGGDFAQTARLCRVSYTCTASSCVRSEWDANGAATTREVASGLLGPEIFSYCEAGSEGPTCGLTASENPTYVGLEVAYPSASGEEGVTFSDGTALRNYLEPVAE